MVSQYLSRWLDDRIERRTKGGAKDRGDIGGVRHMGQRIVIECKNVMKLSLGTWMKEAEVERGNDDAGVAMIIHKRHGSAKPEDQWVTMTVGEFVALVNGNRDHLNKEE